MLRRNILIAVQWREAGQGQSSVLRPWGDRRAERIHRYRARVLRDE